jgi:protein phosphatase
MVQLVATSLPGRVDAGTILQMTARSSSARIEIPADALVLLIGAAGSGKSNLAARLFSAEAILSSDALRGQVSGDPANQRATARAFRILHAQATQRLANGRLTVVDATNIGKAARRPLRAVAALHDRPAIALVLDLPAAVCLERNAARSGRVVPESVVQRQLGELRRTLDRGDLAAEGFDLLVVLTDSAAVDGTTVGLTETGRRATLLPSALPRRTRRSNL